MDLFALDGRRALITGGSRGIGFALARGLARAGAEIVLNGRDAESLAAACATLAAEGAKASAAVFDATSPEAVAAGVGALGPVDILVNCAGIQHRAPLEDFPYDRWKAIQATNLDSAFLVSQAVAPGMIARKSGKIINICSVQSELGRPSITPYAASKGGLKMLTKGMCAEWARHGIQANGLAPGYFRTDMTKALVEDRDFSAWLAARTPAARWGEVEELVGACIFLASPASSFVNGQILYVDGGMTSVV